MNELEHVLAGDSATGGFFESLAVELFTSVYPLCYLQQHRPRHRECTSPDLPGF